MISHAVDWRRGCAAASVTSNRIGYIYLLGSIFDLLESAELGGTAGVSGSGICVGFSSWATSFLFAFFFRPETELMRSDCILS